LVRKLLLVLRIEGHQAAAMRDVFIVQDRRVFVHLDDVDGHGGHFRDDHAPEAVGNVQLGVRKLKLKCVPIAVLENLNVGHLRLVFPNGRRLLVVLLKLAACKVAI